MDKIKTNIIFLLFALFVIYMLSVGKLSKLVTALKGKNTAQKGTQDYVTDPFGNKIPFGSPELSKAKDNVLPQFPPLANPNTSKTIIDPFNPVKQNSNIPYGFPKIIDKSSSPFADSFNNFFNSIKNFFY